MGLEINEEKTKENDRMANKIINFITQTGVKSKTELEKIENVMYLRL